VRIERGPKGDPADPPRRRDRPGKRGRGEGVTLKSDEKIPWELLVTLGEASGREGEAWLHPRAPITEITRPLPFRPYSPRWRGGQRARGRAEASSRRALRQPDNKADEIASDALSRCHARRRDVVESGARVWRTSRECRRGDEVQGVLVTARAICFDPVADPWNRQDNREDSRPEALLLFRARNGDPLGASASGSRAFRERTRATGSNRGLFPA